jgi:hypothetical protein
MASLVPPDAGALVGGLTGSVPPVSLPSVSVPSISAPDLTLPPAVASGSVPGTTPGLYGGTRQLSVCDAKAMVDFLTTHADKGAAWAGALGIAADQIPSYVSGLTDAILRSDTRVTNHGFSGGTAVPKQSILQAGTAVLVDALGIPRVRCFCGNPLDPPAPVKTKIKYTGPGWTGFSPTKVTVIVEGPRVDKLVLVDVRDAKPYARPPGTTGGADVDAPAVATTGSTLSTVPPTTTPSTTVTTVPPTTATTAAPQKVDVTKEGTVAVSSTFSGAFSPALAVDGNQSTSWFSKGDADGATSTFTWRGATDSMITRVSVIGNSRHANAAFRTGQGFNSSTVEVLDAAGTVVFTQAFSGPGSASPNLTATPNVVGRSIRLRLTGHENPQCGGFSELTVEAAR